MGDGGGSLGCGVWIIMPPWEKDPPGGGKEAGVWGRLGCGVCCRDWNPFRILSSDWAAGNELMFGLSLRPDGGPFLQRWIDYELI
jgi:hypothetical protein